MVWNCNKLGVGGTCIVLHHSRWNFWLLWRLGGDAHSFVCFDKMPIILKLSRTLVIANPQFLAFVLLFLSSITMSAATPPIKVTVVGKLFWVWIRVVIFGISTHLEPFVWTNIRLYNCPIGGTHGNEYTGKTYLVQSIDWAWIFMAFVN